MKVIDISWPITEGMTQYKDRQDVRLHAEKNFERDGVRSSLIQLGSHTGTHIDASAHFLADGSFMETIPLERLIGKAHVVDLTVVSDCITAEHLQHCAIQPGTILLLKTRNSSLPPQGPHTSSFVYLEKSGAQFLVDKKVSAVGSDYLGIERNQPAHETHTILLRNNIIIIEGLRLGHVDAGMYQFYCLPLALGKLEAAPARAILMRS